MPQRTAPVVTGTAVNTEDEQVGQDLTRTMKPTGPALESLEPVEVEPVAEMPNKDKLDTIRFMEEKIRIYIHPTDSPTEVQFPEVWNGGRKMTFQRGVETVCERKFVEVLARMKKTSYGNRKVKDEEGFDTYEYPARTGLVYPFTVMDDSARGKSWLKQILAEA